ncbi:hypothetical protein CONLIGDRAFT_640609 [Coniochaeta ligniaria NRRL 30616]|uniref:Uncharacterized protein n=1 Tax=Coniochaeta ligniaria NRRL 30616 TaxID=1408157 RepID=A0A1J7JJD7_9PEZI|nr:hypothetical protein CONLIGDRAFT_640609 [Coniochaeta ligniaria NRRL 30616]
MARAWLQENWLQICHHDSSGCLPMALIIFSVFACVALCNSADVYVWHRNQEEQTASAGDNTRMLTLSEQHPAQHPANHSHAAADHRPGASTTSSFSSTSSLPSAAPSSRAGPLSFPGGETPSGRLRVDHHLGTGDASPALPCPPGRHHLPPAAQRREPDPPAPPTTPPKRADNDPPFPAGLDPGPDGAGRDETYGTNWRANREVARAAAGGAAAVRPPTRGRGWERSTIRANDAEGEFTLEYRTSRARGQPAEHGPAAAGRSEEGEVSNRNRANTRDQQLSAAQLRDLRLNLLGIPTMDPPRADDRRAASTNLPPRPAYRPSGAADPPPPRRPLRHAGPSSEPLTARALSSATHHPTVPTHQPALWSLLAATGHSEVGAAGDDNDNPPPRRRTAREHYYGLNPSPRPSRFRAALRRVVTGVGFRRIGRRIGSALMGRNAGECGEGSQRAASHGHTSYRQMDEDDNDSRSSHHAESRERTEGRDQHRGRSYRTQDMDGSDARARHHGGSGRHGHRDASRAGPAAADYAQRGRSARRVEDRETDEFEAPDRVHNGRRRDHRRETS